MVLEQKVNLSFWELKLLGRIINLTNTLAAYLSNSSIKGVVSRLKLNYHEKSCFLLEYVTRARTPLVEQVPSMLEWEMAKHHLVNGCYLAV